MDHIGDWHDFKPADRSTYPRVDAPVQVRFDNGRIDEGEHSRFFPELGHSRNSSITGWRYIKDKHIK
jgi:hypothetical protein